MEQTLMGIKKNRWKKKHEIIKKMKKVESRNAGRHRQTAEREATKA